MSLRGYSQNKALYIRDMRYANKDNDDLAKA